METAQAEESYENAAHDADSLAEKIDANRVDFSPVISDLLLQKTFDLAKAQTASSSDLKEIIAGFVKLRELELKTRRLQLEASRERGGASPQRHQVDLNIIPPNRPETQRPAVEIDVVPRAARQIQNQKAERQSDT